MSACFSPSFLSVRNYTGLLEIRPEELADSVFDRPQAI
jgi:hypothetical protein